MCKKDDKIKLGEKILEFIKNHRFVVSGFVITIAILISILPQLYFKLPLVLVGETKISGMELIVFSSQIVSSIFVIIGTVIAVWQYYLSSSERIKQLQFSRVEKAIELSNYYKDNILDRYAVVKYVFKDYGIAEMIESKRKKCEIRDFDKEELELIYTEEEIKKFKELSMDQKFIDSIIKIASISNIDLKGYNKCIDNEGENPVVKISVNKNEVFRDFLNTYIIQTLNNVEYFAMAFTHKTADESVIYQSIYPTYLEMCFIMYYFIASDSDPKVAKLYTNLASLYCTWREREQKQKKEIIKQTRNVANHKGTVVD